MSQIDSNTQALRQAISGNAKKVQAAVEHEQLKGEAAAALTGYTDSVQACVASLDWHLAQLDGDLQDARAQSAALERAQAESADSSTLQEARDAQV
jgi:hypothetical protein